MFDGEVGEQELLLGGGVFTVVTLEGPVVGVGQLVVEQKLLVVTRVVAELTLKPGAHTYRSYSLGLYDCDIAAIQNDHNSLVQVH